MNKLGMTDASFLYLETHDMPMNIGSVQKLRPPPDVDYFQRLRRHLTERVGGIGFMTRRLKATPLAMDHPVWIEDPQFDIDRHLVRTRLPSPGNQAQLEAMIGRLHERPLSRKRPLWMYYFIEGLQDGTVALYVKYHHACIDGVAGQAIIDVLFSEDPNTDPEPLAVTHEPDPDSLDLLFDAAQGLIDQAFASTRDLSGRFRAMARITERWLSGEGFGALAERAPRTPFNVAISPYRSWAAASLPLAEGKQMARAARTSLNDVVLAACAGALRRYLERHDALPQASLTCGVPVSLRQPGDASMRNQVTTLVASLGTNIADPVERLAAIGASTRQGKILLKETAALQGGDFHMPGLAPLLSGVADMARQTRLANLAPPAVNVVVSNVPGPRSRRYLCGAELLTHYPVSIPGQSMALNLTVQSYDDRLDFGLTACLEAVPDLPDLRDDLIAAWTELKDALAPEKPAKPRAPEKRRGTSTRRSRRSRTDTAAAA